MKPYAFGIDVGGTTVKMGLFSVRDGLLDKWEIPTRIEDGGQHILPEIAASVTAKLRERNLTDDLIAGIGIGVPGPVSADGTVYKCINLGWGVFNLKEAMNRLLPGIPNVEVGNDATVAARGELWRGGGMGYRSAVLFTLGTGVGGGVVLDGRIIPGTNGGAGEVGHLTVEPNETALCPCGKRGCLEQYASATGLVRMAKLMLAENDTPSSLRNMASFTAKDICDLAREGDKFALDIMDRFGGYLGRGMSYVACTIDPDVFIIGGGMSRAGEVITAPVARHYRKHAFHVSTETPVVIAKLGSDAGIYGAAAMILN